MLINSRILILAFCILAQPVVVPAAQPVVLGGQTALAPDSNVIAPDETPIVLTDNYIQFDKPKTQSTTSTLGAGENILKILKSKYFSLLSWKTYNRSQPTLVPKYKRVEQFGRWINDPNDDVCYNTRALVLMRDSNQDVTFADANKCNVISGNWNDDYTGQTFTKREDIQIDHFVPLKNAYVSGAYNWSFKMRCLYANFLGYRFHLKSVNASQNMIKGDKGPDHYMPPNAAYACPYIKNWLTVKFLWGLSMTESEAATITQLLHDNNCKLSGYKISAADILKQKKFVTEHIDLCNAVAPDVSSTTD